MSRHDIAVIGTGPAGISAAITAKLRGKNVLLLGSANLSDKLAKAHTIQNYPGLPDCTGAELAAAFTAHLKAMDISITEKRVTTVYAMGSYFALQTTDGEMTEATTVILATGVSTAKPYPGEAEYLGRGVSYCATCDAPLYKGKTVAVIGGSPSEEAEVGYLATVCGSVLYFPLYKQAPAVSDKVQVLQEQPKEITGGLKADTLVTDNASHTVDGIFLLRESVAPAQLVPGLTLDGNAVAVDRKMATNLAGCFACGDIVGTPYQYVKSAGEGNVAALSAVSYLDGLKRNNNTNTNTNGGQ